MCTGAPWRDLPPNCGCWSNPHRRFIDGVTKGFGRSYWKSWLMSRIMNGWWLMILIARCILMCQNPREAIRIWATLKGAQYKTASGRGFAWYADPGCYYWKYNSRLHPVWLFDWRNIRQLFTGWSGILTSSAILEQAQSQNIRPVIPPKKNRKTQREYDKNLYRLRHLIENTFLHLKRWRGIATRYAKYSSSFLAVAHVRCINL